MREIDRISRGRGNGTLGERVRTLCSVYAINGLLHALVQEMD